MLLNINLKTGGGGWGGGEAHILGFNCNQLMDSSENLAIRGGKIDSVAVTVALPGIEGNRPETTDTSS